MKGNNIVVTNFHDTHKLTKIPRPLISFQANIRESSLKALKPEKQKQKKEGPFFLGNLSTDYRGVFGASSVLQIIAVSRGVPSTNYVQHVQIRQPEISIIHFTRYY